MSGWIKLHRTMLDWEWYSKPVVRSVFIHCLLRANHKDKKWQGKLVKRGEFISSFGKLSEETGFSVQEIRTAIKHLKSTSDLTSKGMSQHTVFKVENYDKYQDLTSEPTSEQQAINKRATTNKNEKNVRSNNIPYQLIADSYNSILGDSFHRIQKVTDKRKGLIRKFYSNMDKDLDKINSYFEYFKDNATPFHRGDNNRNWKADFEYIIREDTVQKCREDNL